MAGSELFLLLPAGRYDSERPFYLRGADAMPKGDLLKIIKGIEDVETFPTTETYSGYYDKENARAFVSYFEDEGDYPKETTYVMTIINKWGKDWRTSKKQVKGKQYFYLHAPLEDDMLCEIVERKSTSKDDSTYLLINCDAIECHDDVIIVECDGTGCKIDVRRAEIKPIANWLESNRRPQRIFNLNPKHGENGKGAQRLNKGEPVSVLMCSRSEAEALLYKAIGSDPKTLYFFDVNHKQYIEFKREFDNTYHAFHLKKEDENRIPKCIKDGIKLLL